MGCAPKASTGCFDKPMFVINGKSEFNYGKLIYKNNKAVLSSIAGKGDEIMALTGEQFKRSDLDPETKIKSLDKIL